MRTRLVQRQGRRPMVWEISVEGNKVTTTWGPLGGATTSTTEEAPGKYQGKANEVSPEDHALEIAQRYADKRKKQNYREEGGETEELNKVLSIEGLSPGLAMFKPLRTLSKKLERMLEMQEALGLRKHNGYMHAVAYDDFGYPSIFTSKMEAHDHREPNIPWTERYPSLELELRDLKVPPNSILLGEMVASSETSTSSEGYLVDDFEYVGQIIKSLTPKALTDQYNHGALGFVVWDIALWEGECLLQTMPAKERIDRIWELTQGEGWLVSAPERVHWEGHSFRVESQKAPPTSMYFEDQSPKDALLNFALSVGWEGFVIIDPEGTYGDRAYSWHGKPERPSAIAKLKPHYEADVIVRWDPDNKIGERGKGKHAGGVGSVAAFLWHPERGEIPIGGIGTGISDKDTFALADPSLYPMVWEVEFKGWTAKGKLWHPSFDRIRDDKTLEECSYDQCPMLRTI